MVRAHFVSRTWSVLMTPSSRPHQLLLFQSPYRMLIPLAGPASLRRLAESVGSACVWLMGSEWDASLVQELRRRPGGIPLMVVLPRTEEVSRPQDLFSMVEQCRPQSVLPFHMDPNPLDLRSLLAQPPENLPAAVVDYLGWRGLVLDLDLRRTLRRVLELSGEVSTVSGLSRGLYVSRRALGRRFLKEGLPVPSHWLQFGRLLRVALELQQVGRSLMEVAFEQGYPDGFALSNQMKRLLGLRPSQIPERLGWEWIVERWIQEEIREGGFSPDLVRLLTRYHPGPGPELRLLRTDDRRPA